MDGQELLAREAIRDLIARYTHAGDRGRIRELAECFAPDGVLAILDEPPLEGRAAIEARLGHVVTRHAERTHHARMRHHVASIHIEFDGPAAARAYSYFSVYTEVGLDHWGRYADTLTARDGTWLFVRRKVSVEGFAPASRMA